MTKCSCGNEEPCAARKMDKSIAHIMASDLGYKTCPLCGDKLDRRVKP